MLCRYGACRFACASTTVVWNVMRPRRVGKLTEENAYYDCFVAMWLLN